jgi:hypothetical protein
MNKKGMSCIQASGKSNRGWEKQKFSSAFWPYVIVKAVTEVVVAAAHTVLAV